jgi:hypothetical protein
MAPMAEANLECTWQKLEAAIVAQRRLLVDLIDHQRQRAISPSGVEEDD